MDLISNPYTPGAGAQPAALVGRGRELEAFDAIIQRAEQHLRSRGLVLSGLRGVGKTVLLNELHGQAQRAGWLAVKIEAQRDDAGTRDVRYTLARELTAAARTVKSRSTVVTQSLAGALATITSFGFKIGGVGIDLGVDRREGRADSGDLEIDLRELVEDVADAMSHEGKGFVLFIDELQDLDRVILGPLLSVEHASMQDGRPFYVIGAGLPSVRSILPDIRSYAERQFEYRTIDRLSLDDAAKALREPAAQRGVSFQDEAVRLLLEAADGYPYFLQVFGSAAWLSAPGPYEVTAADASAAVVYGTQDLDEGFFPSRWDRATKAERRYMSAMAIDDDRPTAVSDIATRLGKALTGTSPARDKLIAKGLVYAPERGRVAFTVPHMAAYINRLTDRD